MPKYRLHYSSGVAEEIVDAPDGLDAFIAKRFGHINEYLKLGGNPPQLIEEVAADEGSGGSGDGSAEKPARRARAK